jgi:hypothetical protein
MMQTTTLLQATQLPAKEVISSSNNNNNRITTTSHSINIQAIMALINLSCSHHKFPSCFNHYLVVVPRGFIKWETDKWHLSPRPAHQQWL